MPILVLCSDCGKLVDVRPTRDRYLRLTVWSYCERCAAKRALETKKASGQQLLLEAMP